MSTPDVSASIAVFAFLVVVACGMLLLVIGYLIVLREAIRFAMAALRLEIGTQPAVAVRQPREEDLLLRPRIPTAEQRIADDRRFRE